MYVHVCTCVCMYAYMYVHLCINIYRLYDYVFTCIILMSQII